ncbi:MAG: hypothetical protein JRN39_02965 [Nitrososphaerota archaeon]|nr:hypothetical protein [Nitrososphaerota archaeon]MDG6939343.1 hypothetical protein [Nitrososphaerota archaeon]
MNDTDDPVERMLRQVALDIKGAMLLGASDEATKRALEKVVNDSHDEHVQHFFALVREGKGAGGRASALAMALGEIVLASVLIIGGLILLTPLVAGISQPEQLYTYLVQALLAPIVTTPLFPFVRAIEFGLAIVLMLAAMYTLRQAGASFRKAELVIEAGGR